eukprot:20540-Heterococcus_DN1.PRE.2
MFHLLNFAIAEYCVCQRNSRRKIMILHLCLLLCVLQLCAGFMLPMQMTAQQPVSRSRLLKQAVESVALASAGAVVLANGQAAIAADQRDSQDQYVTKDHEVLAPTVGTLAPAFDLPSSRGDGDKISLEGLRGRWIWTSQRCQTPTEHHQALTNAFSGTTGCSIEAARFQKNYEEFQARNGESAALACMHTAVVTPACVSKSCMFQQCSH